MAKFAPVCPINILEEFVMYHTAGSYHLPLAHDVLEHPARYRDVFQNKIRKGSTVILDNSVIELGTAVNIDVIAEAASIVSANVIVLPDVLLDTAKTIYACTKAIDDWTPILNSRLGVGNWSYMYVPQGRTLEGFTRAAEAMRDVPDIGWWGIPRNFNIHGLGSRRLAIDLCHMINSERSIHLLGFSDNLADDMLSARDLRVSGIDSAVPIRAASLGREMSLTLGNDLPPRGDWWGGHNIGPAPVFVPQMLQNLEIVRKYIKTMNDYGPN